MVIVGFVLMFVGIGFFIATFSVALTAFRKLVDLQFQKHREIWVRVGAQWKLPGSVGVQWELPGAILP